MYDKKLTIVGNLYCIASFTYDLKYKKIVGSIQYTAQYALSYALVCWYSTPNITKHSP